MPSRFHGGDMLRCPSGSEALCSGTLRRGSERGWELHVPEPEAKASARCLWLFVEFFFLTIQWFNFPYSELLGVSQPSTRLKVSSSNNGMIRDWSPPGVAMERGREREREIWVAMGWSWIFCKFWGVSQPNEKDTKGIYSFGRGNIGP